MPASARALPDHLQGPRPTAVLIAMGAAIALGACGGDDSEEQSPPAGQDNAPAEAASGDLIPRLESTLKEAIETNSPPIDEIKCPNDVDPGNADTDRFDCEIIGKNQQDSGHVTVDPLGDGRVTYGGQYAGRTELGQGITIE